MAKKPPSGQLNAAQVRFADEYLLDLNKTQAAIRAGYSPKTAATQGNRLFRNVQIRALIDTKMAQRAAKTGVQAEEVLLELARIGLSDIRHTMTWQGEGDDATVQLVPSDEISEAAARAIQSVKIRRRIESREDGPDVVTTEFEVKLYAKETALNLLAKHLNLYAAEAKDARSDLVKLLTAMQGGDADRP